MFIFLYLEINGADANEPPIYFIAFSGDSGNYENVTFSSSSTLSRKPIKSSRKSTTIRTMLLQREHNPNYRCDQQKSDCQTTTISPPLN